MFDRVCLDIRQHLLCQEHNVGYHRKCLSKA
jgi:hypothetical protein